MKNLIKLVILLISFSNFQISFAFIEGLYCGREDCYEVLGVTRSSNRNEIVQAYRKLAKQWHPDRHKEKQKKTEAAKMFTRIANAYEVLKDEESRRDYDYMLDNPEEYYGHYYRYYRRKAPKVELYVVVSVSLVVGSIIWYLCLLHNYHNTVSMFMYEPKYRNQAMRIAEDEGLIVRNKKLNRGKSKEDIKQEEDAILRQVITEKLDLRGALRKPSIQDFLMIKLVLLPIYIVQYIIWYSRWLWKFTIHGEEYGREEQAYLICRNLKIPFGRWEAMEETEQEKMIREGLWDKKTCQAWKEEKEEAMRRKVAESGRMKSYRRYMKKGGPGQMVFGPE